MDAPHPIQVYQMKVSLARINPMIWRQRRDEIAARGNRHPAIAEACRGDPKLVNVPDLYRKRAAPA